MTTDTTLPPKSPQDDLEDALTNIHGVAHVMMALREVGEDGLSYLGGQLHDHERDAQDAFCRIFKLGKYRSPATLLAAETIVDEEGKRWLALLKDEPALGLLVREQFEINEVSGNMVPGGAEFDRLNSRSAELDKRINSCPAETIGGLAWRLGELNRALQDEARISDWARNAIQRAFDDAVSLVAPPAGGAK